MKLEQGAVLIAILMTTGLTGRPVLAAEGAEEAERMETAAAEVRASNRERAEQAQAEAAENAAEAVRSETKLDLDIRLIGPTSMAGEL